jgi:putative transcriptional regulator
VSGGDEAPKGAARTSLGKHLLCAVPQLRDPNFERSVVLMLEHGEDGSLGLVVNNPLPNKVAEVAEGLGLQWVGDPKTTVRLGGPVEPMRGWILHEDAAWDPSAHTLFPGLNLTTSLDPVQRAGHLVCGEHGARFVFLLGYAAWGASQLEDEIAVGSWVAVPVDDAAMGDELIGVSPSWVFETEPEAMWDDALRSIGVDPARLVGLKGGDAALH